MSAALSGMEIYLLYGPCNRRVGVSIGDQEGVRVGVRTGVWVTLLSTCSATSRTAPGKCSLEYSTLCLKAELCFRRE